MTTSFHYRRPADRWRLSSQFREAMGPGYQFPSKMDDRFTARLRSADAHSELDR